MYIVAYLKTSRLVLKKDKREGGVNEIANQKASEQPFIAVLPLEVAVRSSTMSENSIPYLKNQDGI